MTEPREQRGTNCATAQDPPLSPGRTLRSSIVRAIPSPPLRPFVKSYAGFRESGAPVSRHGFPFSTVPLVIAFDDWLMAGDRHQPLRRYPSVVRGLSRTAAAFEHGGYAHGLLLSLTPLGAAQLFDVPGTELSDRIVPLDALLGREADVLVGRLLEQPTWPLRFAVLEEWLHARIAAAPKPPPQIVWAWRRLTASGGRVPIVTLVEELGWSHRHLAQRFGRTVVVTPKTYARLIRFERAIARLSRGDADFGAIALECGYYDQAHFNHDVHAFTGTSPKAVLAQRLAGGGAGFGHVVDASTDGHGA